MRETIIAQRYGEGYLNYAKDKLGLKQAVTELLKLKDIIQDNPHLLKFLETKGVGKVEKNNIVDTVLRPSFSEQVCNYVKFLLEHNRIESLMDIIEYLRKKYAHDGSTDVLLVTADLLDLNIVKLIKESLEKKLENTVSLYMEIDPSLIGGIKLVIGNKILDGSIKGRLNNLKHELVKAEI
jgi:F-type H+-transporting ATPase subunit delta